ncbi:MAG: response regulator [Alphaproteobacteria bacterium]|nr:response regulator [Alphaproteobacteria bacterium]MDD9920505.1 response regulator [Alphaproteobacteria bacterium]
MSKVILTVDDSMTIRQMVGFVLKNAGYTVVSAVDGIDGLNKAKSQHVDLILTDLNMPNMDGLVLTQSLRTETNYATTPIFMMTTESDDEKKTAGQQAGVTGWIVKPFNPDQLLKVIEQALNSEKSATATVTELATG